MSSWDDMLSGKPFSCADPEIEAAADRCREVLFDFNHTRDREAAVAQLRSLFGRTGQSFWVETGFHCDYGCNISVGERFYANAGCVILDECPVTFGRDCMQGPHVGIYTATHPIEGAQRRLGLDHCVVAGNPAKIIRRLDGAHEISSGTF